MKQIIGGKRYDTESAELLGRYDWEYGYNVGTRERLYRTKSGEHFLHASGGSASQYAKTNSYGHGVAPGHRIIPLGRKQAFRWAQVYLKPEETEQYFGDMIEEA